MRTASVDRKTKETDVSVSVNLDGTGAYDVATGIGFFDHMLEQLSRHSLIDMRIQATGDLHIDQHHTVEDVGITLGLALKRAAGDLKGIRRYADAHLPMDETLTRAAVDVSGRPFLVFRIPFSKDKIGDFDVELFEEFFRALAFNAGLTLHVETLYGVNNHHMIESAFKATARVLEAAFAIDPRRAGTIPSTKGSLGD